MNIYEHFSCYTKIPVRLDDIKDHVLEAGPVDEIIRYPIDFKEYIITGGVRIFRSLGAPYEPGKIIAHIGYPRQMPEPWQRIVTAKELLHLIDPPNARSSTQVAVNQLITELTNLAAAKAIGLPTHVDLQNNMLALVVLAPRDALSDLRPLYKKGALSEQQIANMLGIPVAYAHWALTDEWLEAIEKLF